MRLGFVVLVCASGALAQTAQERGKQIIDQTLAALGGDRYLGMQDRVESGRVYSFFREELSGLSRATIYTRYLQAPEPKKPGMLLVRERDAFGKDERNGAVLFTEDNAYQITFRGARPLPADRFDRYKDSVLHNVFYILRQRLGEPGLIIERKASDIIENQPVDIVDITDSDNRVVTVYIHYSTHLPVRQVYYRRDPKTGERNEELTIYSKYRDAGGGVQWPYDIQRFRNGEKVYQIFSDSVEVNKGLTDSLVLLPADMKMLKPER